MPPSAPELMTRDEAGAYFKALRQSRKLRLQDVVDGTTVPTVQYLSALEGGRYNALNSEHFPSLVQFFRLPREEIERIRPGTIVEIVAEAADPDPLMPPTLADFIEQYDGRKGYEALARRKVRDNLLGARNWEGAPQSVEGWQEFYLLNRRFLEKL